MRIILTVSTLAADTGGMARSIPALADALAQTGCSVAVLALRECGRPSQSLGPADPKVATHLIDCSRSRYWPGAWMFTLTKELNALAGDVHDIVVHDSGVWLLSNHLVTSATRHKRLPLVVSPRGMLTKWAIGHKGLKKRIAWLLYQHRDLAWAAVLHATSRQEAEDLRALGLSNPIAVVPNGIILPPAAAAIPSSQRRRVLFLSRLHPKKGLVNLVKAWAELRPEGWECVLAGPDEGGHASEIRQLVEQLGVAGSFVFAGEVMGDQKWDLYRSSNLFVLPSHSENFGLVIGEALAAGLPVITTKATPWEDLVSHRCGWWIDVGVEPLTQALRTAFTLSDSERQEMGRRGRRLVEDKYSWECAAQQMVAVYAWILQRGPRPDCMIL